jgi:hypothetical protein
MQWMNNTDRAAALSPILLFVGRIDVRIDHWTVVAIDIMNFVAQVEDHLRDLGAEARKNYPGEMSATNSNNNIHTPYRTIVK